MADRDRMSSQSSDEMQGDGMQGEGTHSGSSRQHSGGMRSESMQASEEEMLPQHDARTRSSSSCSPEPSMGSSGGSSPG